MGETIVKTYRVHVNPAPHTDDFYFHPAKQRRCHETAPNWRGDNGHRYNVQRIRRKKGWESGVTDFGTCSKLRLYLYLLYLRLMGYRKDERRWT